MCTLSIFGILLGVLALKGFFSGLSNGDPSDGDGEPDDGREDDDDAWFPDMFKNDPTDGSEDPPPPEFVCL